MPLQLLLRPCLRLGLLSRTKPQTTQQNSACRIPAAQPGSHRTAALYQPIFTRPPAGCLCFFLHKRLVHFSIKQAFQPFQFFNRKGKAPCAAVKGL